LGVISFANTTVIVQVIARFRFDLVLRVFTFPVQFSAFDGIPRDRANLIIPWLPHSDLPPMKKMFVRSARYYL
jgi:hypothetical protein